MNEIFKTEKKMFKRISGLSLVLGLSLLGNFSQILLVHSQTINADQIPPAAKLSHPSPLKYSANVQSVLNFNSFQYKGRLFASYEFEGTENQDVRISILGGLASDRDPNLIRTGSLLVNPLVILIDPQGNILAQKPDSVDDAVGIIRLNLPKTGKYLILVTSGNYNTGGRYTLTLDQVKDNGSNFIPKQ